MWTHHSFDCVNGEELAYSVSQNDGRSTATLVLFPGFTSRRLNSTNTRLAELLVPRGVRCIAVDLSGHGDSSGLIQEQTPLKASLEIGDILDRLVPSLAGITERVGVLGNSFSGNAALLAAPGRRVDCLALKSPVPDYVEMRSQNLGRRAMRQWQRDGYLDLPDGPRSNFAFIRDAARTDVFRALREIRVPVMAIFGGKDTEIPPRSRLLFARALKRTHNECIVLQGADHNLSDPFFDVAMDHFARFLTDALLGVHAER